MMRRVVAIVAIAGACVAWPTAAVLADPATPTNYRSEVLGVDPAEGLTVAIVGGDAFVDMQVEPGIEVVILGYENEPYIWFRPDGEVEINRNSPATYLNDDRYAQAPVPEFADAAADPQWERVAGGGSYAWHDHRTHWMSTFVPGVVQDAPEGEVVPIFDWRLPITVDGASGEIVGTLAWVPDDAPLPWLMVAAVLALLSAWAAMRDPRWTQPMIIITGGVAVVAGVGEFLLQPADVRTIGINLVAPVIAVGLAAYARRRPSAFGVAAFTMIAAAALGVWGGLRIATLSRPSLPSVLPIAFERLATSAAIGVALGVLVVLIIDLTRSTDDTVTAPA
jgi:hypothetical protein